VLVAARNDERLTCLKEGRIRAISVVGRPAEESCRYFRKPTLARKPPFRACRPRFVRVKGIHGRASGFLVARFRVDRDRRQAPMEFSMQCQKGASVRP
jgi:hypothetical protein